MHITLLISFLILSSCISKNRSPSSLARQGDASFDLINSNNLLKHEYNFELISLYDLSKNQIIFKNYSISSSESKKAMSDWQSQLRDFISIAQTEQLLKIPGRTVLVKLTDLNRLERALDFAANGSTPEEALRKQAEIVTAFNENLKPSSFGSFSSTIPFEIIKNNPDVSPLGSSSFWTNSVLRKIDHRNFLGDSDLSLIFKNSCKVEPNETIRINCLNRKYKLWPQLKAKVAAMNSLLYHRLGYNVNLSFYVPEVKITYDRNLLKAKDFFNFTGFAQLKSGENIDLKDFKSKLVPYCKTQDYRCFSNSALYNTDFEDRVAYIILPEVAATEDTGSHEFGYWRYDSLDHSQRPEVQALLLIGAFTGNGELQKENNKLIWTRNFEIRHQITNVSGGFSRLRTGSAFDLNNMLWTIMKEKQRASGESILVIDGYQPNVKRSVFVGTEFSQVYRAAKLIAEISEDELTAGLALSGFSAAELLLAREKLISIQKNIIETVNLTSEFPELTARKINRHIEYKLQGRNLALPLKNGRTIQVPEKNLILKNGILKQSSI